MSTSDPSPTGIGRDEAAELGQRSDRALVEDVMTALREPPADPPDSFVLHAPLELMSRAELLEAVDPEARHWARHRMAAIATEWRDRTPHLPVPVAEAGLPLVDAVADGDLDAADRALVELAQSAAGSGLDEVVGTAADGLLPHLGGAGHLAIFLDHLGRLRRAPVAAVVAGRALVRDLARHPDWTIRWVDEPPADHRTGHDFTDVLREPPWAGDPGSSSIHPTMHLVDDVGLAGELLADPAARLPVAETRRQLLRLAAMSMLQDDPAHAPYGWSHCLTMPQAALALAHRMSDPRRAVAVAATYVLGFRATLSSVAVDLAWRPAAPQSHGRLLEAEPDEAVARAWYAEGPGQVMGELATFAATHHDAHLAKYTLACAYAAHDDPEAAPLFRAAAARLATWWRDADRSARAVDEHP